MVLLERIELSASPLPRECSTTELQQREASRTPAADKGSGQRTQQVRSPAPTQNGKAVKRPLFRRLSLDREGQVERRPDLHQRLRERFDVPVIVKG